MAKQPLGGVVGSGALTVDLDAYVARLGATILDVTSSEVELLALLISNQHRVVNRKDLARAMGLRQDRSVDVLLSSLRHKTGRDFVRNVRGRGWILDPDQLGPEPSA